MARGGGSLSDRLSESLHILKDRVLTAPPRLVTDRSMHTFHLYVDASHEDSGSGVGGILTTSSGVRIGYFSEVLDDETLAILNQHGSKNPIYELECFAILIGLSLWMRLFRECQVIVFGGNEGSIHSMISGSSDNPCGCQLISSVHRLTDNEGTNPWFERVNTTSNPADAPSRGVHDPSWGRGARVRADGKGLASAALGCLGVRAPLTETAAGL